MARGGIPDKLEVNRRYSLADLRRDGAALAGAGLVTYGAWAAWPPIGYFVGGVIMLAVAVALTIKGKS